MSLKIHYSATIDITLAKIWRIGQQAFFSWENLPRTFLWVENVSWENISHMIAYNAKIDINGQILKNWQTIFLIILNINILAIFNGILSSAVCTSLVQRVLIRYKYFSIVSTPTLTDVSWIVILLLFLNILNTNSTVI